MTNEPFTQAIHPLLDERGWSLRELARRCEKETDWGTPGTVSLIARGGYPPTRDALENIAKVLRIKPTYFAEYRLMEARRQLDPKQVGLERALKNLEALPRRDAGDLTREELMKALEAQLG